MAAKKKTAKKAAKTAAKTPAKKSATKTVTKPAKKAPKKAVAKKVSAVPAGYHTATPSMCQADATATIAFCQEVFDAKLRYTMPGPGGKLMHAEIQIGDSVVMLTDSVMEPARVSSIFLYVPDVDKTLAKAVNAGCSVLMPAQDMFWGDRFARVSDPFGNLWGLATHFEDVSPAEMKKRMIAEEAKHGQNGSPE